MSGSDQASAALAVFGALLRFHRTRVNMSQERLGKYVDYSKSQVAMVESGKRAPSDKLLSAADELLGAQGALLATAKELDVRQFREEFQDYLDEEAKAVILGSYENSLIPGLLQTAAYSSAVFETACPPLEPDAIEAEVAARLARADIFDRKPKAQISFVVEEIVFTRPLGGNEVLRESLLHVLEVMKVRGVSLQIMPANVRTHAGLSGPMWLVDSADHRRFVYVEGQSGNYMLTDPPGVAWAFSKYATLRAQARNPGESMAWIEEAVKRL